VKGEFVMSSYQGTYTLFFYLGQLVVLVLVFIGVPTASYYGQDWYPIMLFVIALCVVIALLVYWIAKLRSS